MRIAFFIVWLFVSYCSFGQQYYETYTPANGLVDARVNKVVQDRSGRILFLTRDGLSIYDGQRFTNHTKVADQTIGIIEDAIFQADGSTLLATFNGNWINLKKNKDVPDSILYKNIPEISSIITTRQGEHLIVSNYGVYLYESPTQTPLIPVRFVHSNKEIPDRVCVSGNNIVFTYHYPAKDLYLFVSNKQTGAITDSLPIPEAFSTVTDEQENVYLCSIKGILQLDPQSLAQGKLKFTKPWFQSLLPANFFAQTIFFDRQKNIWLINTWEGCRKIEPATGIISSYLPGDGLFQGVSSIFQDKENNYWFIAKGKGVQKLVQTNFETLTTIGQYPAGIMHRLLPAADGSLFFLTEKDLLQLKNNKITSHQKAIAAFPDPAFVWNTNLWRYTSSHTLVSNKNETIRIAEAPNLPDPAYYPAQYSDFDNKGNHMIAGNRFVLLMKNNTATGYPLPYFADNIAQDGNGDYWAFCRSNDIVKLREEKGLLKKTAQFLSKGLEPRHAIHWNKDTFMVATRFGGLAIAKVNDQSLTITGRLTRKEGLSNDFVESLLKIDNHRVAVATAAGLDIITFQPNDTLVENVSARINHFEPVIQLYKDDKGMIYARTENLQVFRFNPFASAAADWQPEAWLNHVLVNGNEMANNLRSFNYLQNNFTFAVSSPSFINNRSIIFRFLLTNENGGEWDQSSNKADFQINNLQPGKYALSVVIKYPGSVYPDKKLEYDFIIRPPFWKTWWFISLFTLVVLVSIYLIVRSYLKQQFQKQKVIMEKELAIEQERTRLARELHDGLGSMLSGVKHSFSAMKTNVPLNDEQEATFQYNIGKLNESITELRDISHSMASESLLKFGLVNSLKDHCRNISQPGFNVSFTALDTEKAQLTEEQTFHIFRIVQELLQNVLKHAGASSAIVQVSYNEKKLYITVEDDGKGFDRLQPGYKEGIGLKNIESRVKALKGKTDLRSAIGTGTSVLIEIPCAEVKESD